MKPDWEKAPPWANYASMDKDGQWWWYEIEPTLTDNEYVFFISAGRFEIITETNKWKETLEKRPDV